MTDKPLDTSALIRATIFVRDLERATNFYRILGLSDVYFEGTLDHPSATTVLGFNETYPYSIRILKQPGPNFGMVGLFEMPKAWNAEEVPMASGPARLGEVALVFYVRDMHRTLAALREAGAVWAPEPVLFVMEHRSQLEVCIRDCDGTLINLVETDPAEQNRTKPELSYKSE